MATQTNEFIEVAFFNAENDTTPHPERLTWESFVHRIGQIRRTACGASCVGKGCSFRLGPGWSGARYRAGGRRRGSDIVAITVLSFDLDCVAPAAFDECKRRIEAAGVASAFIPTHSHRPGKPSMRLVIRPSREVQPREWAPLRVTLIERFAIPADDAAADSARLWFQRSIPEGLPVAPILVQDGPSLDVEEALRGVPISDSLPEAPASPPEADLTPEVEAQIMELTDRYPPAVQNERGDARTFQLGMRLRDRGLSLEQAWPFMLHYNRRCLPPWEEADLRKKLENAYRYAKGLPGDLRLENAKLAWGRYWGQGSSNAERFSFERATDLLTRVVAPLVWFIRGFVPEKSVLVIAGEPKTSKTWLALTMAIAVSARKALFNVFGVPGIERSGVAYFALEDSERSFRTRLIALARGMDLDPLEAVRHIHVRCRAPLNLLDDDDLCSFLAACPPNLALLVIDPLRDAHTGEENSSGDMAEVMKRLRFLRDTLGCSVLFIHHSAKAGPDKAQRRPGQLMRGSSAVHGAVDGGIYLALTKATEAEWVNTVFVELKAGRGAGTFGLMLSVEDDENGEAKVARWTYSPEATAKGQEELAEHAERVVLMLRRAHEENPPGHQGMSREAIRTALGVGKAKADAVVTELIGRGRARSAKPEGGIVFVPGGGAQ